MNLKLERKVRKDLGKIYKQIITPKIQQTSVEKLLRLYENGISNEVTYHRLIIDNVLYGG